MSRTDCHRPGAIIPSEYDYVLSYSLASHSDGLLVPAMGVDCVNEIRDAKGNPIGTHHGARCCTTALRAAGAVFFHDGRLGICDVCGASYVHGDVWLHRPTGQHVHLGHTCAAKYELLADRTDHELRMGRAREGAARAAKAAENKADREAFLAANPGLAEALETDHPITQDMAAKLATYRSLSPAQVALCFKLHADNWAPVREELHVPAPRGRVTFTGVVVSTKVQEGDWGATLKLIVKVMTDAGSWLCYLSAPRGVTEDAWGIAHPAGATTGQILKGRTVELTATLEPGRDPHFAFGKRPNGRIVDMPAAEVVS